MIYRVYLKVSYYERIFDFNEVNDAAKFAETILLHEVPSEDNSTPKTEVMMSVINKEDEDEKEVIDR